MKRLVLIIYIISCATNNVFSQGNIMYPIGDKYIPIWNINNENMTILYPGNVHFGSTQGGMLGIGDFSIEGNSDVTIKANAIHFKNTHIGSADPNFKVHANNKCLKLASNYNYSNSTMSNGVQVPLYEKIEFGIELPEEIQEKINLFLNSNTSAADPNHPGLNPYDPQDISVEATVTGTLADARYLINQQDYNESLPSSVTVYGFYYQEATPTPDLTGWTVNTATPYPFRVRMAPPYKGNYDVTFKVTYRDNGSYSTIDLSGTTTGPNQNGGGTISIGFQAVANTSGKAIAKGYIKVGKHKRHLRHSYDNTSFFPIGMNLPELPEPPGFNWNRDPLRYTPFGYNIRRDSYLTNLAYNHGNFVRMISFAEVNAIETAAGGYENTKFVPNYTSFGQLGNYQKNQKHMWETDKDIKSCEDLSIFLNFCLQIHFPLEKINGNDENWEHNAYKIELGLGDVKDFFSNPNANRFFKNKLRYAQARWGYSVAIGMWQLASEISQSGIIAIPGKGPYFHDSQYYDQDHVQKLYDWQCVMTDYIKSVYPNHLTNTCYALNPFGNYSGSLGNNPACVDKSFTCSNMDIISWNYYNYDALEDINRSRFDAVTNVIYNTDNVDCGMDPAGYFIDKPLLFTEVGTNKDYTFTDNSPSPQEIAHSDYIDTLDRNIDKCTDIEVHNQMWAGAMSGELGTPLEWHNNTDINSLNSYFSNFNALKSFFDDIDFETHKYRPSVDNASKLFHGGGPWRDDNDSAIGDLMPFELYVMQNDFSNSPSDRGFGWLHNLKSNWDAFTEGYIYNDCSIATNSSEGFVAETKNEIYKYRLNHFKAGNYNIETYNTRSGALIHHYSASDNETPFVDPITHVLRLKLPFEDLDATNPDIAFKFWHASVNGNDLRESKFHRITTNSKYEIDQHRAEIINKCDAYPNPVEDEIFLTSSQLKIINVSIKELTGKEIESISNISRNLIRLNTAEYSTGCYIITCLFDDFNTQNFKIIKL